MAPDSRCIALACVLANLAGAQPAAPSMRGVNLIQSPNALFGSAASHVSFERLRAIGVNTVAVVPFLFQSEPASPAVGLGDAVSDAQLIAGIRDAKRFGLRVVLKPHVWVAGHWAGEIAMRSASEWRQWFAAYGRAITHYARIAEAEHVELFVIGVELEKTIAQPEWRDIVRDVRAAYHGRVTYVAHGTEELPRVPFWSSLDVIGISLYPAFGADTSEAALHGVVRHTMADVRRYAAAAGKPLLVAEAGIRSAKDAQLKSWESPEERAAAPDEVTQAKILGLWISETEARPPDGLLIWRWLSDPNAGGPADTDFTPQHKLAEGLLFTRFPPSNRPR